MKSPSSNDGPWEKIMNDAWNALESPSDPHPSEDVLASYSEGGLEPEEREKCEGHLSRCPKCFELVRGLWAQLKNAENTDAPARKTGARVLNRYLLAASVLIALLGAGWGTREYLSRTAIERDAAKIKERLAETHHQLAEVHQEKFLAQYSSGMRAHWVGKANPKTLQLPVVRGPAKLSPEASLELELAKNNLTELLATPSRRGQALLELAFLETVAGNLVEAEKLIADAELALGKSPEVLNAHAIRLTAKGDKQAIHDAETILGNVTKTNPDFLPSWYNLALLLQRQFRDDESRKTWMEFLKRETREEFRKAAEEHLAAIAR